MQADTTSQISPWLQPSVLVPTAIAIVGLIAWLVRLEFKANGTVTRLAEHEDDTEVGVKKMETNHDALKKAFYEHKGDTAVHHNAEAFNEFRERLRDRFDGVDKRFDGVVNTLGEIKALVEAGRNK